MIIDDAVYEKLKKQAKQTGSVSGMLGQHWSGALTYKANEEFELSIKDEILGDVIHLNEDAIEDLLTILSFRKEIRDRWEAL
jgi:hypothetical protein